MINELLFKKISNNVKKNTSDIKNILDSNIYSLNEVKTNKVWIDGKPIYRKVIEYNSNTALSNGDNNISHNVTHIGSYRKIVDEQYIYQNNIYFHYASSTFSAFVSGITDSSLTVIINGWGDLFKHAYFTIEYTKTTD